MNPQDLPHDVYGLVPYQPPLWGYIIAAAIGLATLLALYMLWKKYRKHKMAAKPLEPKADPLKVCLAALRALEPTEPFTRREQNNFFFQLSMIFREYIELTLNVPATDSTTGELKTHLARVFTIDRETKKSYIQFLESADMVKFAEKEVSLQSAEEQKNLILSWVEHLENQRIRRETTQPLKPSSEGVAYEV